MKKLIPAFIYLMLRSTAVIFAAKSLELGEQQLAAAEAQPSVSEINKVSDAKDLKGSCKRGKSCFSPGCRDWVDHDCDGHCDRGY